LFASQEPSFARFFEQEQLRLLDRVAPELGDDLGGSARFAGFHQGTSLYQPSAYQVLPEFGGSRSIGSQLLGRGQVVPGGIHIVAVQMAFAPFRVSPGDLGQQLEGSFVSFKSGLAKKLSRIFQTPVLERLLSLPD
jgi:hypothetical protein